MAGVEKPTAPQPKAIKVTVGYGQTLGDLAIAHHTTVESIMKLNGLKNADFIREGAVITVNSISEKDWQHYQDLEARYYELKNEQEEKEAIKKRTALAQAKIQKAKENGREDDYSFSIDKEGYVVIKLKTNKKLHEIRSEMGLNPGTLDDLNGFERRYGQIPTVNDGVRDIETWDNLEAQEGETFRISTAEMQTTRTWTQFFKDMWPF